MIQSNKRPEQRALANLTDYSTQCPEGLKFVANRKEANEIILARFADCLRYLERYSLQEAQ